MDEEAEGLAVSQLLEDLRKDQPSSARGTPQQLLGPVDHEEALPRGKPRDLLPLAKRETPLPCRRRDQEVRDNGLRKILTIIICAYGSFSYLARRV
jgi:hypothetical protein